MNRVIFLAALSFCTAASAESLEEKQKRAEVEQYIQQTLKENSKSCGAGYDISIDWASWKTAQDNAARGVCRDVLSSINWMCVPRPHGYDAKSAQLAKEAIQKQIKHVICMGDGEGDIKFELKDGKFIVHAHHGPLDASKKTSEWLSKSL